MNTRTSITAVFSLCLLFFIPCAFTSAADAQANVAGTWTIAVSGETGSASQTIVLKQEGGKITGSFKGPRQSGDLEGTVDGNKIAFHVKTPVPGELLFRVTTGHVTMFYKRECQEKKLLPRLEGAKKFFLTSSPCIDVRIRDFSDSPDSSCWRNDVHRFLMHQAVWL